MKIIQENKKAYHDYTILEKYETGIVLKGSEVVSIRNKSVNLKGSYCSFDSDTKLVVHGIHIAKLITNNSWTKHEEKRPRNLLLKKKELVKLKKGIEEKGYTIIPLKIYFNDSNKCKLKIGLAKGKDNYDKRKSIKEKDIKRETERSLKDY